jgi:hypothetical protein
VSLFPVFLSSDVCFDAFIRGLAWPTLGWKVGSNGSVSAIVENVYKCPQQYNVSGEDLKKVISKCDDSESVGKYHTLDLKKWEEITYWVSDKNRIGVGRPHSGKELTIFMQLEDVGKPATCRNYILFLKSNFVELRQLRGENKYKE